MEKINIAELLKDCPKGMELYSTIYGTVYFKGVRDTGNAVLIDVKTSCNTEVQFYPDGKFNTYYSDSEMTLFPSKDVRTWEGFTPPCQFKDGDVVVDDSGAIFIYKQIHPLYDKSYADFYCGLTSELRSFVIKAGELQRCGKISSLRHATEEEKEELFNTINDSGYCWNDESKTLEKLIKPTPKPCFKCGDKIRHKKNKAIIKTIDCIYSDSYSYALRDGHLLFFSEQDQYELVPNKFDITTLVPFDKVLVRNTNKDHWMISMFGYLSKGDKQYFMCIARSGFYQCIPYEGNEHLLGTTDDCDDFYKTWNK